MFQAQNRVREVERDLVKLDLQLEEQKAITDEKTKIADEALLSLERTT